MRINHNIASMVAQGSLFMVNRDNNKVLEKLSTGLRINRASDDAAGLSVSENLRTQVRGMGMAKRNAQDGISALQIAEGALNEISDILQRMRELSVQSANDTLTSTERAYTNQEFDAIRSEIQRIVDATQYNTQTLLDGTGFGGSGGTYLHIGANDGTADEIAITIDPVDTASLAIDGLDVTAQTAATDAISALDFAINTVNTVRSNIGAYVNRLDHTINNLINGEHNMQGAESVIRDTDFAQETAMFTRSQILMQSATAMLAQANMVPQSVLGLLGR